MGIFAVFGMMMMFLRNVLCGMELLSELRHQYNKKKLACNLLAYTLLACTLLACAAAQCCGCKGPKTGDTVVTIKMATDVGKVGSKC